MCRRQTCNFTSMFNQKHRKVPAWQLAFQSMFNQQNFSSLICVEQFTAMPWIFDLEVGYNSALEKKKLFEYLFMLWILLWGNGRWREASSETDWDWASFISRFLMIRIRCRCLLLLIIFYDYMDGKIFERVSLLLSFSFSSFILPLSLCYYFLVILFLCVSFSLQFSFTAVLFLCSSLSLQLSLLQFSFSAVLCYCSSLSLQFSATAVLFYCVSIPY